LERYIVLVFFEYNIKTNFVGVLYEHIKRGERKLMIKPVQSLCHSFYQNPRPFLGAKRVEVERRNVMEKDSTSFSSILKKALAETSK